MNDAGLKQHSNSTKHEAPPKKTHHVFRADVAVLHEEWFSKLSSTVPFSICSSDSPADPVYEECELLHLELTNGVPGRPHQPACGSTPRCPAGPTKSQWKIRKLLRFSRHFHPCSISVHWFGRIFRMCGKKCKTWGDLSKPRTCEIWVWAWSWTMIFDGMKPTGPAFTWKNLGIWAVKSVFCTPTWQFLLRKMILNQRILLVGELCVIIPCTSIYPILPYPRKAC